MERVMPVEDFNPDLFSFIWEKALPTKVQFFVWRAVRGMLPTKVELQKRNSLPANSDTWCPVCRKAPEQIPHLLLECEGASELWSMVVDWIGVAGPRRIDTQLNMVDFGNLVGGKLYGLGLRCIWACTAWTIWRQRNKLVFEGGSWDTVQMLNDIKAHSWCWLSYRRKGVRRGTDFQSWSIKPFSCFDSG